MATVTPRLTWSIFDPAAHQSAVRLTIHAGGCCESGAPLVCDVTLEGEAAAGTAYAVPAAAGLTTSTTYHWYLTPRDREGRWAYAPVEGVFAVAPAVGGRAAMTAIGLAPLDLATRAPFGISRWSHSEFADLW